MNSDTMHMCVRICTYVCAYVCGRVCFLNNRIPKRNLSSAQYSMRKAIYLVWFYGISTIVGYLMLILFTHILDIWFVNTFC